MTDDRPHLPQLEHTPFLTDGGLETTLIFNEGVNLPVFAAFVLLETADGRRRLRRYFERHAEIAREADCGFIAEAPTWRANPDWREGWATTAAPWTRSTRAQSHSSPTYETVTDWVEAST
jgi:homocysteine S-methyltransferase